MAAKGLPPRRVSGASLPSPGVGAPAVLLPPAEAGAGRGLLGLFPSLPCPSLPART